MEAEKRILNDKERSTWLEARKRWDDAEKDYCNMLRQKSRIRIPLIEDRVGSVTRKDAVADLIGLGDFRPISLIECYYKIIAKMLLERVKRVVEIVVGEEQNTFIKGRYILDGVLIANETLEFLKKKKVYFLLILVKVFLSPSEEFRLERRVRQGDHLSSFFFILAADGLNAIANETVEKGIFRGVAIGENNIMVSHLQYADYTILLGNEINRTPNLLCVSLNVLGSFSGQTEQVNYPALRIIISIHGLWGVWMTWKDLGSGDEVWSDIVKIGEEIDGMGIKFSSSCVGVDQWRWSLGGDGDFKVKDLSSIIEEKILPSESGGQETLWNKLVPKKISIFMWRALRGRLSVREELDRRDQDIQTLMVDDNVGNQFRQNAVQNVRHLVGQNAVQNQAQDEGNANRNNGNQIRCYNCQGDDHLACNCRVKPGKQDAAYLQKHMQIALKE
ncbi:reverse transcriptase domain, reverse transcriptase zinc-binding domain protein [Tanacetum coccineum]